MNTADVKKKLTRLIEKADAVKNDIVIYVIASTKQNTNTKFDYPEHSITTSYLSLIDLQEIIGYFQQRGFYTILYNDIEEYLSDFYNDEIQNKSKMIFETSPKGIGRGKDALIPCICDLDNIKHLGPTANVNCLCSSKYQWTSILNYHNIPVPKSHFFTCDSWITQPIEGKKYILKLNYECASIGLTEHSVIVENKNSITINAQQLSKKYSQAVLAQEFIDGYEVEVPVIVGNEGIVVLPPVGLSYNSNKILGSVFLNYNTIYNDNYGFYNFSLEDETICDKIIEAVKKVVKILDLNGYLRVDFRIREDGAFYIIDINNDPCINSHGSYLASLTYMEMKRSDIAPILVGNSI